MIQPAELVTVLDSILEGIQVLGQDWRYLHLNDTAARHGRSTKEALLGRTIHECYPGIERTRVFELMRQAMVDRTSHVIENRFEFPDGSVGFFELRIQPVPQGICVLSIDVTERRTAEKERTRAEEMLRHGQRMEALGHLSAGVAHDFNNLLTVILGQIEVASKLTGDLPREELEPARQAALSAAQLTRQLLAFGRQSVLSREVIDLQEVVRGLESLLRRTLDSRIELVLDADAPVGRVDVDRMQVEQILMNLVVNARDAIPARGRITIALAHADLDPDYVATHPGSRTGPHAVLTVTDTGTGMDAATRARIFEPFFTTKKPGNGTGLGLATVYGIVKQHGGNIWVHSEIGAGTSFEIYLPCTDLPVTSRAATRTSGASKKAAASILVVDDSPDLAQLVARILAIDAHTVFVATSAEAALDHWQTNADAVDLLITDVMMPSMSGGELIDRVRTSRPDLPVLCMSGGHDPHVADAGVRPRHTSFLEKPFTPTQLLQEVQRLLASEVR
ncbi:MAG: response regulator [Planctomycetota bacterium]